MQKVFKKEIEILFNRLKSGKKFAFSKYADGEWAILNNKMIHARGEFLYNPQRDENFSKVLLESYQYKDEGYYIGVSCPCCQGIETHKRMIELSGQDDEHVSYANMFVNSNYDYYVNNFVPFYKTQKVILVCNKNGKVINLPFKPEQVYFIDQNAFTTNYDLVDKMKEEHKDTKDHLFLFCAGPLGNVLSYKLWENNKNNTYLDVGSTLNPWLQSEGHRRDYYTGKTLAYRDCVWGN